MKAVESLKILRGGLGPHAGRLCDEMLSCFDRGDYAAVIILAAAVLDVGLREPSGYAADADGLALAAARDDRDAFWLRGRRNGIVHYEGGQGGLMGNDVDILKTDSRRALEVLVKSLEKLSC